MAVSGRKASGCRESVFKGSAEDFANKCELCLFIGQHNETHGFCVECQQYLCISCIAYHQRITATKNHQFLNKGQICKQTRPKKDTTMCTETCTIHKHKIIKFFCTNHEHLGCSDCISLNHRACKIDYIPDKCADCAESQEYRETLRDIDKNMRDIETIIEKAEETDNEIDLSHDRLTKEIVKFRKQIDDQIDILQNKIEKKAEELKSKNKGTIAKVLETCNAVSSGMKELKFNLQDSKPDEKTYILIKQAQSKLKTYGAVTAEVLVEQADFQYIFRRNKEFEHCLSKQDTFGTLSLSTTKVTSREKKILEKFTHKGNINIRTKTDYHKCLITGCAFLSSNKVVLADSNNWKLKMVDLERKLVSEENNYSFRSQPLNIAVLPQDQIAVTVPGEKRILILTAADKLTVIFRIEVRKGECRGITYHQGLLYSLCWYPNSVLIADTKGNVRRTIDLKNEIFNSPYYIHKSENSEHIYLSDFGNDCIVCVTQEGAILEVYTQRDLLGPAGMVMSNDGSLFVCCFKNGTIHHISGDLKQGQIIQDCLKNQYSICYNQHKQEFYVGGLCDQLMIMKYERGYR